MSTHEHAERQKAAAEPKPTYVVREDFPREEPTVKIVFHGLLCFFFDGQRGCEVGVHNTTQGLARAHSHQHDYIINVWAKFRGQCIPVPERRHVGNSKLVGDLKIGVVNPRLLDGVYVYEKPPLDTFDRLDPQNQNDARDWRWIIDFERDVYPGGVKVKKANAFRPSVRIENGLFYTLLKTNSTFKLHPSGDTNPSHDKPIGSVAEILAANIYLEPGGSVVLSGGPFSNILPHPPLVALPGVTYQVDITNNCNSAFPGCHFNSGPGNAKEERNDFFLHYDLFDKAQNRPEYELILVDKGAPRNPDICLEQGTGKVIRTTDDTPCGGVGFDKTPPP